MDQLALVKNVLELEAKALLRARERLTAETVEQIVSLFQWLTQTGGNLVVSGVGKSGHVGTKIAATFSSLGLPSFFLHPTEALHGDLGRVTKSDVMLMISKSGTTEELMNMLPYLQLPRERLIALVGNPHSPIAARCGVVLDVSVEKEACLNDLAPTTSTTLAMAMGDALAVLLESVRGVSREQFAINHPAGLLGKSLSLTVQKLMVPQEECAAVMASTLMQEALIVMTQKPVGLLAVLDGKKLLGIIVEGDIRRALTQDAQALSKPVSNFMNAKPSNVAPGVLAFEALKIMESRERPISALPVVEDGEFRGVLRLHDLFRAGFSATSPR
jgi:arabinose-5-phosphate isomerase